jgi:hypothetical protein
MSLTFFYSVLLNSRHLLEPPRISMYTIPLNGLTTKGKKKEQQLTMEHLSSTRVKDCMVWHTLLKKLSDFPVPSRDVTKLSLAGNN